MRSMRTGLSICSMGVSSMNRGVGPRPVFQDLRYALRTFARSPGLVAAAVVCLALGIGANATIFGVVDTLLFRAPPHVQDPEQVVRLYVQRNLPRFGATTSR